MWYQGIVFLHVIGALSFFLAHGVSVGVALRLGRERRIEGLRALLDLSMASRMAATLSFFVVLVSGLGAGFLGSWWGKGWFWTSLGIFVLITIGMVQGGTPYFNALRKAVGTGYREGGKLLPAGNPATAAEIDGLLQASSRMKPMAVIALALTIALVYLMRFKPF